MGLPVSVPMLDIHTVGAGGGSLARFDAGGVLHVGPESAGAAPGPICYGKGERGTVTDANLILGRLDAEMFLGGGVRLDEGRTREWMGRGCGVLSVEEYAAGIVRLAEAAMEKAVRMISVERGNDPQEFTLVAFGGAGPLHACALARALRIPRVMVPVMPGALSALGILMADVVRDYSRTVMSTISSDFDLQRLELHFDSLEAKGAAEFCEEGLVGKSERLVDLRYVGQGYELNVAAGAGMMEAFHAHRKRFGYADATRAVEVVRVRLTARSETVDLPVSEVRDGDGSQALVKSRSIFFERAWVESTVYDRAALREEIASWVRR